MERPPTVAGLAWMLDAFDVEFAAGNAACSTFTRCARPRCFKVGGRAMSERIKDAGE